MLRITSPQKIVATLLAKNEEDILRTTIEHHIAQGVQSFIATNNNSSDRTKVILESYPEVKEIIDEPGDDHRQSEWVTRMARLACQFQPDWIIHLDADELWCGLQNLSKVNSNCVSSPRMYLHPPCGDKFDLHEMRYYLDLDHLALLGECKIAHRPNPNIVITHGNHGIEGIEASPTAWLWRHHFPIRSFEQMVSKGVNGHLALQKRQSVCERWQKWYNLHLSGELKTVYDQICSEWQAMIRQPNTKSLLTLLEFWSTSEVIDYFRKSGQLPKIGEWPRRLNEG